MQYTFITKYDDEEHVRRLHKTYFDKHKPLYGILYKTRLFALLEIDSPEDATYLALMLGDEFAPFDNRKYVTRFLTDIDNLPFSLGV